MQLIIFGHIAGALSALVASFGALRFPNGSRAHRRLGLVYVGGWLGLFFTGVATGWRNPSVSVFEVLNLLGISFVALGYTVLRLRRRSGSRWLVLHFNAMISSLAFLVIATLNQVLPRLGLPYPWWSLIILSILPFFVIPPYAVRLTRRFGRQRRGQASAAE